MAPSASLRGSVVLRKSKRLYSRSRAFARARQRDNERPLPAYRNRRRLRSSSVFGFAYRTACPDCGAPVETTAHDHVCDEERRLSHQLSVLRVRIDAFEDDLSAWLETPQGRFASWDATRRRAA